MCVLAHTNVRVRTRSRPRACGCARVCACAHTYIHRYLRHSEEVLVVGRVHPDDPLRARARLGRFARADLPTQVRLLEPETADDGADEDEGQGRAENHEADPMQVHVPGIRNVHVCE